MVTASEALAGLERLSEVMYLRIDACRLARREIEQTKSD